MMWNKSSNWTLRPLLASGYRDGCLYYSKDVLKQMNWNFGSSDDNVWLALQKIKADQHQASPSNTTLQVIMTDLPTLMFFSVASIRGCYSICKEDINVHWCYQQRSAKTIALLCVWTGNSLLFGKNLASGCSHATWACDILSIAHLT